MGGNTESTVRTETRGGRGRGGVDMIMIQKHAGSNKVRRNRTANAFYKKIPSHVFIIIELKYNSRKLFAI